MRRAGRAGFTLIEAAAALAIAVLAVAGLVHLVRDAFDLDDRIAARGRAIDGTAALFNLLDTLLVTPAYALRDEAALAANRQDPGGSGVGGPSVSGTEDAVTIRSRGPAVLGLSRSVPFTLAHLTDEDGRGRVVLRWRTPDGALESETVTGARAIRLRYAARTGAGTVVWSDRWSGPVEALAMIEARVEDDASGRLSVRTVAVTPTLPRVCARQPALKGCPAWQ